MGYWIDSTRLFLRESTKTSIPVLGSKETKNPLKSKVLHYLGMKWAITEWKASKIRILRSFPQEYCQRLCQLSPQQGVKFHRSSRGFPSFGKPSRIFLVCYGQV